VCCKERRRKCRIGITISRDGFVKARPSGIDVCEDDMTFM
jgi:hypothetical protein